MTLEVPVCFTDADKDAVEQWLKLNSSNLPQITAINGKECNVIGIYNDCKQLVSVKVLVKE